MNKSFRYIVLSFVVLLGLSAPQAFAGNKDRSGQAGASELLINPWAATSGWVMQACRSFMALMPSSATWQASARAAPWM